jgi:hypothetical protein
MKRFKRGFIFGLALMGFVFTTCKIDSDEPDAAITYTAAADGSATAASTAITFTFAEAVTGLKVEDIILTNGTGQVTKKMLVPEEDGKVWKLGITVHKTGTVKVGIRNVRVVQDETELTVYKADITYTATANGTDNTTTSTAITFTFGEGVTDLTAEQITLTKGTGTAAKGDLTGSGTTWYLEITVQQAGTVKVTITREGIKAMETPVTVYKAGETTPIGYEVAVNGADNTTTSDKITFTFGAALTDLTAEQITLTKDTGTAAKGDLTGSGTTWRLGITVQQAGTVKVTITRDGIETGEKTVTVHTAPAGNEGGGFIPSTNISVTNDAATLGFTGTAADSSDTAIATATISNGKIAITSVAQGNATITVRAAGYTDASIPVTVAANGDITIETITKGTSTVPSFTLSVNDDIANDAATLGFAGTEVASTNPAIATATISQGNIVIASVAVGTAIITVSAEGYTNASIAVTVAADGSIAIGTITPGISTGAGDGPALDSIEAVADYLNNAAGGTTTNPVSLVVQINLSAGDPTNWAALITAIGAADKFVVLDLSACALNGTEFNPEKDAANLYTGKAKVLSLVLPNVATSVTPGTSYQASSFSRFSNLKSITSLGITTIEQNVFSCPSLVSVTVPNAVSINGTYAFRGATALTRVNFPKLASMGSFTFVDCAALTRVDLPQLAILLPSAFSGCAELTRVNISGVSEIKPQGFVKAFKANAAVTIIMGGTAPTLGKNIFSNVAASVVVTVEVPADAMGYDDPWKTSFLQGGGITSGNLSIVEQ